MARKFREYKNFDLSQINKEISALWKDEHTFDQSLTTREGCKPFVFYEGPPSANGVPGIHHVMARTIKDIFCRFKTQSGFHVKRKAGWDTHGLPVELALEKARNITKEDIGTTISIEEFNEACREDVMKYTDKWEELTEIMGYWIDMSDPYITYDNKYIETVWYLLKELMNKDLLYKGYTIQPYSPAAGSGLSTHELNQPGCYRDVKDTTVVAQFRVQKDERSEFLFRKTNSEVFILAWTTTPWTLPSNTALSVGKNIEYSLIETFNQYTGEPVAVVLASDLVNTYFNPKHAERSLDDFKPGDKHIPFKLLKKFKGKDLLGISYDQLLDWVKPQGSAFRVIAGDFVTTEEGTGIVHTAPTFGADDYRVSVANGIDAILVRDKSGMSNPLVDKKGRFFRVEDLDPNFVDRQMNLETYGAFAGKYVKNEYDSSKNEDDDTIDVDIAVYLKQNNQAFRIEKYIHNYPHCWRTDKPVLYYPMDSWMIRTTAMKDRMIELNNTINWKPEATGTGRFGKWLENLLDWNLSRSRFWGTPLPIWISEDGNEQKAIGSVAELKAEIERSVEAGFMNDNPLKDFVEGDFSAENYKKFDLHRPFVDSIILVSSTGKEMIRETDLIDVWFDSGAMPYAQIHYPFEHREDFDKYYPADFIAEGVDQTRGWFFTLHAIATMLFDSVSFRNIISNGLVLDKNGNKMSKRLNNAVDPYDTIEKFGSDPLRWYMISNAQPWDNIKFDLQGVEEVRRKFFGTLYNSYSFFALYANIDGFNFSKPSVPVAERPEIDRWIMSLLNSLVIEAKEQYENYEPTRAARLIQEFVLENLSNWYVRLNRKRFWGGEFNNDKLSAYQTLYICLETIARLASPIAPFYMEKLYRDLNDVTGAHEQPSVHLCGFPYTESKFLNPESEKLRGLSKDNIDRDLEERMNIAQTVTSMVLGLRRKVNIKVRQPLNKIMIPVLDHTFKEKLDGVKELILNEVNVKSLEYLHDTEGILVKKIKPDFKRLGPRYGALMKQIAAAVAKMDQKEIAAIEQLGEFHLDIQGKKITLLRDDVEITSEDIPGWLVATEVTITVALDITITEDLRYEGIARELVNRIQNIRKDSNFEVTDKIKILIEKQALVASAISKYSKYISSQTLAKSIDFTDDFTGNNAREIDLGEDIVLKIKISKQEN
ncbi:MAG: isoleucine--tRNA ligase [Bacteroidales bacterium]|nr:isoleucine--tRNA ligase [Bacteroidales bacterium]